jgi:protein O-mannosyl-transferase
VQPQSGVSKAPAALQPILAGFALALITLAVFWPVARYGFVNYDDQPYVTENARVQAGLTRASVAWAFATFHASNWHPVTWLSHMVDCQLYGLKPGRHHFTSLLLHVANVLLLFGVLRRMTGATWRSAVVAALFAWHPLHVESVAWVAERKDVLSTFFWLLTMAAYAPYAEIKRQTPNARLQIRGLYLLALLFFALGLLSKPMVVTLPFVLLLLDYWPLQRFACARARGVQAENQTRTRDLVMEKIPFLVLTVASCVVTLLAQKAGGALASTGIAPVALRLGNAVVSYARYAQKIFWPQKLAIFYPLPSSWPWESVAAAAVFLVAVSIIAILARRRCPWLAVGWFWFVITLAPVIGLVQVGLQAMADRYTYVPAIGLFIAVVWGVNELAAKWGQSRWAIAATAAALAACLILTRVQLGYWKDSVVLFQHALDVTGPSSVACVNEGTALLARGSLAEGIAQLRQGIDLNPNNAYACGQLATALDRQGNTREAVSYYRQSLRIDPDVTESLNNLAWILASTRDASLRNGAEAVRLAERACELTHYQQAIYMSTLGAAYAEAGRFADAVNAAERAAGLAASQGNQQVAKNDRLLMQLYRTNRPYHQAR